MALSNSSTTTPLRALTPTAPTLDPLTNPTTAVPNPAPNTALGISQLGDGAGGSVTVPPTSMAPAPSTPLTWDQAIAANPLQGPTFTMGPGGSVGSFQQADGTWTNANGSPLAAGTDQWGRSTFTGTGMQPSSTGGVANPTAGQPVPTPPAPATGVGGLLNQLAAGGTGSGGPEAGGVLSALAGGLSPSGAPNDARPSIPGAPGASTAIGADPRAQSTFSDTSNLINSQINPTGSPRLLGAQSQTDAALGKVLDGPDRAQLGQQYYDNFATRAKSNFDRGIRDATNAAAAHGQIGSGMLTNHYGDLAERFNLDNTTAASDYATRALEGTIGDRFNNANLARSVESQLYGQDAGNRNELRGERDYQQQMAEQAIARRIQQAQMESQQQQQDFQNGDELYRLGNAPDPTGAYLTASGLSSADASQYGQDTQALIRFLATNRDKYPSYPSGGY